MSHADLFVYDVVLYVRCKTELVCTLGKYQDTESTQTSVLFLCASSELARKVPSSYVTMTTKTVGIALLHRLNPKDTKERNRKQW